MRLREVEGIARRVVPGRGAVRASRLGAGLLHDTYRIDRDGRAFSLRLAATGARASVRQNAWLLQVLQLAADRALAPALVCGDAHRGIVVQEWAAGRAWPARSLRRTPNIERFAQLLRRVHALAPPAPARASSPRAWVRHYTAALTAPQGGARRVVAAADRGLAAAADARLARLEALPRVAGVVCHSDLHRLNVLEYRPTRGRIQGLLLLDWEYAHVSEPYWDLAGWSANNDFPDALLRKFLGAYLRRAPHEREWTRCKLLIWLYDYVCLLWSQLYLSSYRRRAAAGRAHGGGAIVQIETRAAFLGARLSASPD